jgi:hypothetical protein
MSRIRASRPNRSSTVVRLVGAVRHAATAVVNAPVTVAASAVATVAAMAVSVKTAVAAVLVRRVMASRVQVLRAVRAAARLSKLRCCQLLKGHL